MTLLDLLTSPWAITPEKLLEIQAIYSTHLRGEKIDIEAIEARIGRPLSNEQQTYEVRQGGIAVLPVSGVISAKANLFTQVSGGASAQMLTKQIESMGADPRVRGVVLDFDTPGGSVFGIPAMGQAIRALSEAKPTASVSTGMMASAGYWTGSAANAVYASGTTDIIGSIGVVMTHKYDPRGGQSQTTEITAGKYKRMATDSKPLDKEGAAYLQQQVDHIYSVFVATVAENRRTTAEQVLANMADGRVFIGQQAADAGLIDGFATVDDMVEKMATSPEKFAKRHRAVFALGGLPAAGAAAAVATAPEADEPVLPVTSTTVTTEETHMTPQELAEKFKAEHPEAAAIILAAGAAAETTRAASVREQCIPGHEKLIEALAADGKTTGAEAAMAVLAAERGSRNAQTTARAADAVPPVKAVATAEVEPKAEAKGDLLTNPAALDKAAREYMAAHKGVDYLAAVRAVSVEA